MSTISHQEHCDFTAHNMDTWCIFSLVGQEKYYIAQKVMRVSQNHPLPESVRPSLFLISLPISSGQKPDSVLLFKKSRCSLDDFSSIWQRLLHTNLFLNYASTCSGFTLTPGPMVDARVRLRRYCPFAAAGFAFIIAPIRVRKFSSSFSWPKDTFPIGT